MLRRLPWVDHAKQVFELELPADHVDTNGPDLASVRFAALCIGVFIVKSAREGEAIPILDERRTVRVWFVAKKRSVLGFAIEVSYDGGRTFENPLLRYPQFTQGSDQVPN
jgi:hypothetical protein